MRFYSFHTAIKDSYIHKIDMIEKKTIEIYAKAIKAIVKNGPV